jgi:nitrous oxide reductase
MNSWIFNELNRREFLKKTALTGAAAYLGIGSDSVSGVEISLLGAAAGGRTPAP